MNVEIETDAAQFPEKEYINGIFLAVWFPFFSLYLFYLDTVDTTMEKRYVLSNNQRMLDHSLYRSRIHELTVSLRFLGTILRFLRLGFPPFSSTVDNNWAVETVRGCVSWRNRNLKAKMQMWPWIVRGKTLKLLSQLRPRIRPLYLECRTKTHMTISSIPRN